MPPQLISYDLGYPGRDYSALHKAIEALGSPHWHCLESVWIVMTPLTSIQVRERLERCLDQSDTLCVFQLEGQWASVNLSEECSGWLERNLG